MAYNPANLLDSLRRRLDNPAVSDSELLGYLNDSMRDVTRSLYSLSDYEAQLLDTACHYLLCDGKFPDIASITSGGVTTSLGGGPDKFLSRINGRRQAAWMLGSCR